VRTVLVADDQEIVRTYVQGILRKEGFHVLEAADGLEALKQVEQRGAPIDLLLTDIRMPRMDGIALTRSVIEIYPKTPVLYMSGYSFDLEEERTMLAASACAFLAKPFTRKALLDAIQELLYPPQNENESGTAG
jgi:two-component system cell cycle sensor histidine kinase/response regulator CckA